MGYAESHMELLRARAVGPPTGLPETNRCGTASVARGACAAHKVEDLEG